jgi:hypothetical protein
LDPSGILTILGLAVAVYAIIPREKRLDIGLRISNTDWLIIGTTLVVVHYIIYFPVLKEIGFAFDLGYWRYGFNEENSIYLIFLGLGAFLIIRAKMARVKRSNISSANELFEELILEKKYGEVALLTEQHIREITKVKRSDSYRNQLANNIRPASYFDTHFEKKKPGYLDMHFSKQLIWISSRIEKDDGKSEVATNIIRRLINNYGFVRHLSISRPYLGITIIEIDTGFTEDFLKNFIYSLLENEGSIYYYELEHTQNLTSNNRYYLSKSNRLLQYLFNDIKVSEKLAIYKPVGDKVCEFIEYDEKLIVRYNEPLGTYYESQRFKCPIDSSIHFFEIMIIESMHQGIRWHMWLYYLPTFVRKILDKLKPSPDVDLSSEWPTPFYYILYHIVSVMLDWLDEYSHVDDKSQLQMENENLCHDNGSIPKSTVLALGNIVFMIISSHSVSEHFKTDILEIVLRHLRDKSHDDDQASLNRVLMKSILRNGFHNKLDREYIEIFQEYYQAVDHVIRFELEEFNTLLESTRLECDPA